MKRLDLKTISLSVHPDLQCMSKHVGLINVHFNNHNWCARTCMLVFAHQPSVNIWPRVTTHWSSLTVREHGPRLIFSILHFSCARKTMAVCWHHHTSGEEHKRSQKTWRKHKQSSAICNVKKTQNCKLTKFCFCGLSDGWIDGCINPAGGLLEKLKARLKPQQWLEIETCHLPGTLCAVYLTCY